MNITAIATHPYPPSEWTAAGPHMPRLGVLGATARAAWNGLIAAHPEQPQDRPPLVGFNTRSFADATLDSVRALLLGLDHYAQYLAEEQRTKSAQG